MKIKNFDDEKNIITGIEEKVKELRISVQKEVYDKREKELEEFRKNNKVPMVFLFYRKKFDEYSKKENEIYIKYRNNPLLIELDKWENWFFKNSIYSSPDNGWSGGGCGIG